MGGFIEVIAEECRIDELELSGTKCVATASTKKLGQRLQMRWNDAGLRIPYS